MRYQVRFIDDNQLPIEVDWAVVIGADESFFIVKRSAVCPAVLEEAWRAFVRMTDSKHAVAAA